MVGPFLLAAIALVCLGVAVGYVIGFSRGVNHTLNQMLRPKDARLL